MLSQQVSDAYDASQLPPDRLAMTILTQSLSMQQHFGQSAVRHPVHAMVDQIKNLMSVLSMHMAVFEFKGSPNISVTPQALLVLMAIRKSKGLRV